MKRRNHKYRGFWISPMPPDKDGRKWFIEFYYLSGERWPVEQCWQFVTLAEAKQWIRDCF